MLKNVEETSFWRAPHYLGRSKASFWKIKPIPETMRCAVQIAHSLKDLFRHGLVIQAVSGFRVDGNITQLLGHTVDDSLMDNELPAATGGSVPPRLHVQKGERELQN